MTKPDDGGPVYPVSEDAARGKVAGVYGGISIRAHFAAQFAAKWLPIAAPQMLDEGHGYETIIPVVNAWGLAQADDLLRRLREEQT